jgi:hypothetical protein
MKARTLLVVFLLIAILSALFLSCDPKGPVEVPDKKDPGEPEDPPPPPPPPPAAGAQSACLQDGTIASSPASLEQIAREVLSGKYGSVLQKMLADEVSTCLNQMSEEGVIDISSEESEKSITIEYGENGLIMFDMGYMGGKIDRGEFGADARLAMRRLIGASGN